MCKLAAHDPVTNERRTTTRTEPYSFWFHPHLSFLDRLVQIVVCFLTGLYVFPRYSPNDRSQELDNRLRRCRQMFLPGYDRESAPHMKKWSKAMQCPIVEHRLVIPRKNDILVQWGIVTPQEKERILGNNKDDTAPPLKDVEILFRFPAKLLPSDAVVAKKKKPSGTYTLGVLDIDQLLETNKDVPVVVYYHGGGLTVGGNGDSVGAEFLSRPSAEANKPVIIASVSYHLAPEYAFPTAIEDALTGFSFLSDIMLRAHSNDTRKVPLHIAGPSAGANLACAVTMESHRRSPGLIKSAMLMCPMLDPVADSMSYYLNSKSSWVATVPWLRWCYQGYLRLEKEDELLPGQRMRDLPLDERLRIGSNRTAFAKSKWSGTPYERLVRPMADLPSEGLENTHTAPNILVTSQEADPLRDEAFEFVEVLTTAKGMLPSKLKHIHTSGSHHFGLVVDLAATQRVTAWCIDSYFPTTKE